MAVQRILDGLEVPFVLSLLQTVLSIDSAVRVLLSRPKLLVIAVYSSQRRTFHCSKFLSPLVGNNDKLQERVSGTAARQAVLEGTIRSRSNLHFSSPANLLQKALTVAFLELFGTEFFLLKAFNQ